MNEGMLWLDDAKDRTIEDKITRALAWYKEYYGPKPNLCFVNQTALEEATQINGVDVKPAPFVLPNHFWIGSSS